MIRMRDSVVSAMICAAFFLGAGICVGQPSPADLGVTKIASLTTVPIGTSLVYTIGVANHGPGVASDVVLTDTLPVGLGLVSETHTQGNVLQSGSLITANLGALAAEGGATVTLQVIPTTPGDIVNVASVAGVESDFNFANNLAIATNTAIPAADLSVAKSASVSGARVGDTFVYQIGVTNHGPSTAENVTVHDTLPAGTEFDSETHTQGTAMHTGNEVTGLVGTLAADAGATITITVRAVAPGQAANTAIVESTVVDLVAGNNGTPPAIVDIVATADVSITKAASVTTTTTNGTIVYTIGVTNHGPSPAESVTITDILPIGVTYVSETHTQGSVAHAGGTVTGNLGTVAANAGATITLTVQAVAPGIVSNAASVASATDDPVSGNNVTAPVDVEVFPAADLSLTKEGTPNPVGTGEDLLYTLVATNNGPDAATSVTVVDSLPDGVTFVSVDSTQGTCVQSAGTVQCDAGTLATGDSTTITVIVVPLVCGQLSNTASVTATEFDPNTVNNSVSADIEAKPAVIGPFVFKDDEFTTDVTNPVPGGTTGWTPIGTFVPGSITGDYDQQNTALRVTVSSSTTSQLRIAGWFTANTERIPYSTVGTGNYIRAKFYVFTANQENPGDLNQVPNVRMRVSSRFAVSSVLEVFNHLQGDPAGNTFASELRPSNLATSPSVYRVDFDPIDVPALDVAGEGISRGFEAYSLENQENGDVELAEASIGYYPAQCIASSGDLIAVYQPTATDAGNLKVMNSTTDLSIQTLDLSYVEDTDPAHQPLYSESNLGVTADSRPVPTDRIGILNREFDPGADLTLRARVEPAKQYQVRWHVVSTTNANRNPKLTLRGRSIKFMWSQKYEVGGAYATDGYTAVIAQQALPGVGCQNPDKDASENGGWYTLLMHTPMSPDIRAEVAGSLAAKMPFISAQPGPGEDTSSVRDLRVAFDQIDTLSSSRYKAREAGEFTIDRIEVRSYELVAD
jgi:uncharacterized repeat protein (TIGR01451 family)